MEVLPSLLLFLLAVIILLTLNYFRPIAEKTWLRLNYLWLITALFSLIAMVPELRERKHGFDLTMSENYLVAVSRNIGLISSYVTMYDLEIPRAGEKIGDKILWDDELLQANLSEQAVQRFGDYELFKDWAENVHDSLSKGESVSSVRDLLESFQPIAPAIESLADEVRSIAGKVLLQQEEVERKTEDIGANGFRDFSLFCIAFLLPISLSIPFAHNAVLIRRLG